MSFIPSATNSIRTVPPEGDKNAKICLIGEAPGAVEVQQLRPFVGPAGGVLEQCLHAAGITRSSCYLTNIFKFQIIKKLGNIYHPDGALLWHARKGFTLDGERYLNELALELERIRANVLVPLGGVALEGLTKKKGIMKWRGSILEYPLPPYSVRKCIPTIHPAATLRGDYLSRYHIIFDLRRIKEEAEYPEIRLPQQTFVIDPSFDEVMRNLKFLKTKGLSGASINYDIEIVNLEVSCISFAVDLSWAISVPIQGKWTTEEEAQIWLAIADILEDGRIAKQNQNILFDMFTVLTKNKIMTMGRLDDPMVGNHIIYPDFKKGLDFLTSIWTKIPYYKDEGKVWFKGVGTDIKRFWEYNAQDSATASECMRQLSSELDRTNHRKMYEQTIRLYRPLLAMMCRGMKIDKDELEKSREHMRQMLDASQAELNKLCGRDLNVNSTKQCQEYFYVQKGIKPYVNRKTGRPTTDDKAMARLARGTSTRPGLPEAKVVQRIRGLRKMLSTYMDITPDPDGRVRCSYNPRGTTTGRLSSSQTIFGTGMNMQNIPPEFKKFLVADDGYILIEIDKRQAEWVVVAYASGDARMLEVVEKGLDPHTRTGELITGVPPELIIKEHKIVGHETDPIRIEELRNEHCPELFSYPYIPRTMSIRQCGKKSNHGLNYGMGASLFALINEILENEAKIIVTKYHEVYPGIRNNYYATIQEQLGKNRTITNCFGRLRQFLGRWGPDLFNQAYNFIPQSTVADLINQGIIKIYEDTRHPMDKVELLGQVHDSVLLQYPLFIGDLDYNLKALRVVICKCINYLNPVMRYRGRDFRIPSDVTVGLNWGDMRETKIDTLPETIQKIRREA